MAQSKSLIALGAVSLVSVSTLAAFAQPLPPGAAVPSIAAPPPTVAAPAFDPNQLPAARGTVAHFTLTPRGEIDGFIFADGTEVHVPPHLSTQIAYIVRLGDPVTVHGLRATAVALVEAASVTDEASGQTIVDNGPAWGGGPQQQSAGAAAGWITVDGRVQAALHGRLGEINGAILQDGTILRLPPPAAERFTALLSPGQIIAAQGYGLTTALGRVVEVQAIGPSPSQLSQIQAPQPPPGPGGKPRPRP